MPTGRLPLATHTELPVEHDVKPSLHGSDGVQTTFAAHGTQLPALHTRSAPQLTPLATLVPVS